MRVGRVFLKIILNKLERTTYDNNSKIIEYTKSVSRGDKFIYHVVLEK